MREGAATAKNKKSRHEDGFFKESLERAMGIEPTALAWEARVLPLYDAREERHFTRGSGFLAIDAFRRTRAAVDNESLGLAEVGQ